MSAVLIGTVDFCHSILLSVTLSLVADHKASAKENLLASFFLAHFSTQADQD